MSLKKIVYIIPGYEGAEPIPKIDALFRESGIEPIFVKIDWDYASPAEFSHYVSDFLGVFKKPKGAKAYVFGFSFGANIALLSAQETKPDALILCSLSPFFIEDYESMSTSDRKWWKESYVRSDISFDAAASQFTCPTHVLVGEKEGELSISRSKEAHRQIECSTLEIIKGAEHNVSQKTYMEALKSAISRL
jgi:pimeloyl-ACP methyl ester carboxylesterase